MSRRTLIFGFLIAVALFSAAVFRVAYVAALGQAAERGAADLSLAADRLLAQLVRYRTLAVLLSDHPEVTGLFSGTVDARRAQSLLLKTADQNGPLDIAVVGTAGRVLAQSDPNSRVDHQGTPYLDRARQGALGAFHWAGETGRIFVFAAPIFSDFGPVQGAVILSIDMSAVEADWRGAAQTVWFTDDLGVVFLSNRSELVLKRDGDGVDLTSDSADYTGGPLLPFPGYVQRMVGGHEVWTIEGGPYLPGRALHLTRDMPVIKMTAELLQDAAPARRLALLQASVAGAMLMAFGLLLLWMADRLRLKEQTAAILERRVAERTSELSAANTALRKEVRERKEAEAALNRAQADLVQAGKLGALGQMSAGISHELNQPLMAIRSFSENAQTFLDRDQPDRAAANLGRIAELARRMGRIISSLRAFARQESVPVGDVDLGGVVTAVLEMTDSRRTAEGVALHWSPPETPVFVRGGEVRLQQVLLNLVTNALDAMEGRTDRDLWLEISVTDRVRLSVRDSGPGITDADRIFDPFYTTKEIGAAEGMGLGLSISYGLVQSFGGDIRGKTHPHGGAVFTVELDQAKGPALAAE